MFLLNERLSKILSSVDMLLLSVNLPVLLNERRVGLVIAVHGFLA
jgi:hypothetical protein